MCMYAPNAPHALGRTMRNLAHMLPMCLGHAHTHARADDARADSAPVFVPGMWPGALSSDEHSNPLSRTFQSTSWLPWTRMGMAEGQWKDRRVEFASAWRTLGGGFGQARAHPLVWRPPPRSSTDPPHHSRVDRRGWARRGAPGSRAEPSESAAPDSTYP